MWFIFLFYVSVIHSQGYRATTAMTETPHDPRWTADKVIDGNTSQDYQSNQMCFIKYR